MPRTGRGICAKFVLKAAHLGITGEFESSLKQSLRICHFLRFQYFSLITPKQTHTQYTTKN